MLNIICVSCFHRDECGQTTSTETVQFIKMQFTITSNSKKKRKAFKKKQQKNKNPARPQPSRQDPNYFLSSAKAPDRMNTTMRAELRLRDQDRSSFSRQSRTRRSERFNTSAIQSFECFSRPAERNLSRRFSWQVEDKPAYSGPPTKGSADKPTFVLSLENKEPGEITLLHHAYPWR